jgi:transcriptional regulator with XRE-family HTH domain
VGEQLRQARQEKSLSLEAVAAATRIGRANLQAIEAMDFERLPADAFTKGQVILYAAFLGLDARTLADQFFRARDGGKRPRPTPLQQSLRKQQLKPKKLAAPTHVSSATIASILLLVIVCSFTVFCLYFSWNPFAFLKSRIFPPAAVTKTSFHPADPATSNNTGQRNTLQLQAFFKKDSRILVTFDNKPAVEQIHAKGVQVLLEADKQMSVEFFQPDSADLQLNGVQISFPEESGDRFLLHLQHPSPSTSAP